MINHFHAIFSFKQYYFCSKIYSDNPMLSKNIWADEQVQIQQWLATMIMLYFVVSRNEEPHSCHHSWVEAQQDSHKLYELIEIYRVLF